MIPLNKIKLGFMPTPVGILESLSEMLGGPEIWIKRDDLTGLALGGNKTRKLEYILCDALANAADTIVTAGAVQSNHCRQTAAAAAQLGLECHLVLGGNEPENISGNLLLDRMLGAKIHWAGSNRKGEDIPEIVSQLRQQGKNPYIVPYGGSNEFGALGFASALFELDQQMDTSKLSHIVFASSSGGTQAGLMLGKALLHKSYTIHGINIDKDMSCKSKSFAQIIADLANSTSEKIQAGKRFELNDVTLDSNYVGAGYGVVGDKEIEAISMLARQEGILLDPVYTARAMGGLIDMIKTGYFSKHDRVLFWHTGGAPSLFSYARELLS
ncbi:MAG: D-cysteine desulfhydrase family protein [Gammaproteobacteria bacterium]|nr:D-cysteine desulfhydrase family protein [Gammaproteobacteria bacterium]